MKIYQMIIVESSTQFGESVTVKAYGKYDLVPMLDEMFKQSVITEIEYNKCTKYVRSLTRSYDGCTFKTDNKLLMKDFFYGWNEATCYFLSQGWEPFQEHEAHQYRRLCFKREVN